MMTDDELATALAGPRPHSLFDQAEADDLAWDFLEEDPELLAALYGLAMGMGKGTEDPMLDGDDLFQSSLCFLSVRPELQQQTHSYVLWRCLGHMRDMRDAAMGRVRRGLASERHFDQDWDGIDAAA